MSDNVTIRLYEIVGSPLCVDAEDGEKVYEEIKSGIESGKNVIVSFLNITSLTSAFLNAAIGQLYGKFSEEMIRERLTPSDIDRDDAALLIRVVDTAKKYFSDPERFRSIVNEHRGDVDDE